MGRELRQFRYLRMMEYMTEAQKIELRQGRFTSIWKRAATRELMGLPCTPELSVEKKVLVSTRLRMKRAFKVAQTVEQRFLEQMSEETKLRFPKNNMKYASSYMG